MKKVMLADGVVIDNCTDATTPVNIFAVRDTYADAAAIRDIFKDENTKVIQVSDEDGTGIVRESNLVLENGIAVQEIENGKKQVTIILRHKTDVEIMRDEIMELQEVILDI